MQGLEVAGDDKTYKWDVITSCREGRTTIFPDHAYETLPGRALRKGVQRILDGHGYDVVAVNGWSAPEARAALAWRRGSSGRRAVLMSETRRNDTRRWWWREAVKHRILRDCDAALVGGGVHADYLSELGIGQERIFTGYDAVDNDYFERKAVLAQRQRGAFRQRYGLPNHYFLACTRFLPRKNVDALLRGYDRYRRLSGSLAWGLVVLGDGAEAGRLRQVEEDLKLRGVIWPGFVQYDVLPILLWLGVCIRPRGQV